MGRKGCYQNYSCEATIKSESTVCQRTLTDCLNFVPYSFSMFISLYFPIMFDLDVISCRYNSPVPTNVLANLPQVCWAQSLINQ
jgi:hypothetical protein